MESAPCVKNLFILAPLYFDGESFRRLRTELCLVSEGAGFRDVRFVVIDDSGGMDPDVPALVRDDTRIISVPFNLGHQRAIVYGLRQLAHSLCDDDVIVTLDSDGEDQPTDVPRLLSALLADPANRRCVAVAVRTRRREPAPFKLLYFFFKRVFLLLTGTYIRSGNFAAYRGWLARNILRHPHFDLCYSSSLVSLNLQVKGVPCERGVRYAGRSSMTYLKLVMHGIRMLMPFADRIAIRGMVLFASLLGLGAILGAAVLAVRIFTRLAIPGWATYTLLLAMILCGVALASLVLLFSLFVQTLALSMRRLEQRQIGLSDGPDA